MDILRVKVNGVWTDIPAIQGGKGDKGDKGDTGVSPSITVTDISGGHRVTITDADGAHSFDVMDGEDGQGAVQDVQVNGVSVLNEGVANVPIAGADQYGVIKVAAGTSSVGIWMNGDILCVRPAPNGAIKEPSQYDYRPIVPWQQHRSTFYGLASAAGDATQSQSSNPVGTYTDEAKAAIQQMLDVPSNDDIPDVPVQDVQVNGVSVVQDGVANVPVATNGGRAGVIQVSSSYGHNVVSGILTHKPALTSTIKNGRDTTDPVVASNAHDAAFYGLAKAAGDTTQSQSSNAVGNYTETAKSKISEMLSAPITVSGTTPSITALSGIQYVCGEVSTLDIALPASGIVDVVFTSGSTPTVLTITPPTGMTVEWANGFDSTALEADTLYELNIKMVSTKCLGVAGQWS